jgi:hypothetical protein
MNVEVYPGVRSGGRWLVLDYPCPFLYTRPHIIENTKTIVGGVSVHHFRRHRGVW